MTVSVLHPFFLSMDLESKLCKLFAHLVVIIEGNIYLFWNEVLYLTFIGHGEACRCSSFLALRDS